MVLGLRVLDVDVLVERRCWCWWWWMWKWRRGGGVGAEVELAVMREIVFRV